MREPVYLFDIPMHPWTMEQTLQEIDHRLMEDVFTQHVVVNVAKLVTMRKDLKLKESVLSCDIINIDGAGIVFGGRWLGLDIPERVAGIDLFYRLLGLASRKKYPVFFLGATTEVVQKTVDNIREQYPSLKIAGYHHGYFWDHEESIVEEIRESGAKLLFVAISSPRKENFVNEFGSQLGGKFGMGVGGTFDIVAGETKRAPVWMQNLGLEWLFRVVQEPRRMWRRYLYTNSCYIAWILKEKIKKSLLRQ